MIQVIGSVSLAILPLLWMWKDIDFRYLSRLRPGVYLDSRHLFVVYPDDVIVVGLRGLRIGRDVQEVYGYSSGAEVELEAGGCRFDIWVSTSKFVELLKAHLLSIANQTGTDGKILDGGEDPWLALASTQEDPAAAKRGRIRRTAKAMVLIWLGFCLLNLFAGQAFGYWMLLQNYKSGHNRTAVLKSVREEVPEWYRSRLEREVWTIVQRTHTISELIWFLNWRGSHDFRLIAEANLRSLAGAKLSRGQGAVDSASPLLQAWLSQVTQTGLWRIRVSVRDSAPTWPRELFEGEDPNALVGAYDSIFVKSAFDAISEQAHLPDSLPLGIHSASDTSLPLLMVESVPLDSTGASGEAFRRWRVALPDGSTLMDLRLPVDAWQMSQLGLSAQESALGEYLRSAMRQKLDPSMDSAGKAWKESGQ
ncbi:MAG: hypothetical protein IPN71_06040 [Fibrobacteres bacterium]|nr:hypothetical protein [Fibrobacterota bacterium]